MQSKGKDDDIYGCFLILSDLASGCLYDHWGGASPVGLDWRSIIYRAKLREVSGSLMTFVPSFVSVWRNHRTSIRL